MRYSKVLITRMVKGVDGEERLYKAYKLPTLELAKEGYEILLSILPSIGTGLDDIKNEESLISSNTTWTAAFQLLRNNLTPEHFETLQYKLLGSLLFVDTPITADHFDKYPGDYFEVITWLFKENFTAFFTESGMLRSKIQNVKRMAQESPMMNDLIENVWKEVEPDTKK